MAEKELETDLVSRLRSGDTVIPITNSTSDASSLTDLCCGTAFEIFQDDSRWNSYPDFMHDVIGGMTPDIVLRSKASGENRIYIEVKETHVLGYGTTDSQIVRYFLHLLATSTRLTGGPSEIRRGILLAAPPKWFSDTRTGFDWNEFVENYSGLAKAFDITLGEICIAQPVVGAPRIKNPLASLRSGQQAGVAPFRSVMLSPD